MKVALAALCLCATQSIAWEFTETTICTVTHNSADLRVELIFDPAASLYEIALIRPDTPWAQADAFRLQFDGPRPLIIGTDRHERTPDGSRLSVTDTGFGNVLDGLQFNDTMTARNGDQTVSVETTDATAALEAFRDCPSTPTS